MSTPIPVIDLTGDEEESITTSSSSTSSRQLGKRPLSPSATSSDLDTDLVLSCKRSRTEEEPSLGFHFSYLKEYSEARIYFKKLLSVLSEAPLSPEARHGEQLILAIFRDHNRPFIKAEIAKRVFHSSTFLDVYAPRFTKVGKYTRTSATIGPVQRLILATEKYPMLVCVELTGDIQFHIFLDVYADAYANSLRETTLAIAGAIPQVPGDLAKLMADYYVPYY